MSSIAEIQADHLKSMIAWADVAEGFADALTPDKERDFSIACSMVTIHATVINSASMVIQSSATAEFPGIARAALVSAPAEDVTA
jgi:hypothetical protein